MTGARSFVGSNLNFDANSVVLTDSDADVKGGLVAVGDALTTTSVHDNSAGAGAVLDDEGCPRFSVYFLASSRACTSVVPPGAKGTTMRTVFAGQDCAQAVGTYSGAAIKAAATMIFPIILLLLCVSGLQSTSPG